MKSIALVSIFLLLGPILYAQGISINADNTPPHASAIFDIQSSNQGILIPRMTMIQRDLITSPALGLMIYQTDVAPGLYLYDGTVWQILTTASNVWSTAGNGGTDPASAFIGTTDNTPIRFRINNTWAGELNLNNIYLGENAGVNTLNGVNNIGIGRSALQNITTGYGNVAIGSNALLLSSANNNIAIGNSALANNLSGGNNCAVGSFAMLFNSIGQNNCAFGHEALVYNVVGSNNVAIGKSALATNSGGDNNVAVGATTLTSNLSGSDNTALGAAALHNNNSGIQNTAVGKSALHNSIAGNNTAVGYKAGFSTLNSSYNTTVGARSLENNITGAYNTAMGSYALFASNSEGNTAIGHAALEDNTSGPGNTATGFLALEDNTIGQYNTAIGYEALEGNITGNYNIAVGAFSGTNISYPDLYNTIGISNTSHLHTISNQVVIGNSSHLYIGGVVPWTVYSDRRIKKDVKENVVGLDFITRLRPVTYYRDIDVQDSLTGNTSKLNFPHKYDAEQIRYSGFIAQEVENAAIESGFDFSGIIQPTNNLSLYALSYESFVVPLVKAIQEQQTIIETLKQQHAAQNEIIHKQQNAIDELKKRSVDLDVRLNAMEHLKTNN